MNNVVIKPTVGRIVHYRPEAQQAELHAAIVAKVNQDGTINLGVFTPDGGIYGRRDVKLLQDGQDVPTSGHYAEWPPRTGIGTAVQPNEETPAPEAA